MISITIAVLCWTKCLDRYKDVKECKQLSAKQKAGQCFFRTIDFFTLVLVLGAFDFQISLLRQWSLNKEDSQEFLSP